MDMLDILLAAAPRTVGIGFLIVCPVMAFTGSLRTARVIIGMSAVTFVLAMAVGFVATQGRLARLLPPLFALALMCLAGMIAGAVLGAGLYRLSRNHRQRPTEDGTDKPRH